MVSIRLEDVGVTFRVRMDGRLTLKEYLVQKRFLRSRSRVREIHALDGVSLELREGDRIGVIGHNGAGKSTLLKVLAGVYPPTRGRRSIQGRVSSLFDVQLGFEMEANGWENIAYRGYLQGETPRSIRAKMPAIAAFSELGEFLDMPLRCYSSGMLVRLAFSIATAIEPEILLVDEVLSAGDHAFQGKARERMGELLSRSRIVVAVSHDLTSLARLCDRIVWLEHGRVRQVGPARDLIAAYKGNAPAAA